MRPDELGRSVDNLTSSAAEGSLIARDVARHRTKRTFVRARSRELVETVDHEAEKLSDATARESITKDKNIALSLADQISAALGQLQTSPDDGKVAAQVKRKLDDLTKQGDSLSKGL